MGYRRMTKEDIYEILRRWHDGQNVSRISEVEECDRKTICKYIQKFNEAGFGRDKKLPDKERVWDIFEQKILPSVDRLRPASEQLEPLQDIIRDMVQDAKEPLKPKSVYRVLKDKHNIDVSYETYKIFVRNKGLTNIADCHLFSLCIPRTRNPLWKASSTCLNTMGESQRYNP
jgi:hypothetical protein